MTDIPPSDMASPPPVDVIVIGGGAAGIMAALEVRRAGASARLLERNERLGKKILISGGGKCNITNIDVRAEHFHGSYPRFAQDVLRAFDQNDLRQWLAELGLATVEGEEYGKIWPASMTSKSVVQVLDTALRDARVEVVTGADVTGIQAPGNDGLFAIATRAGITHRARAVVMASGGLAAPHLGAVGAGLHIAEGLGHKLVPQHPALVGLVIQESWVASLSGLTCDEVDITLEIEGKQMLTVSGSLLFTHYGLTSPAVFRLSREVAPALEEGKRVRLLVNWRPDRMASLDDAKRLAHEGLGSGTKKHAGTMTGEIVGYRKLGEELVRQAGGDPDKRVRELQKKQRDMLEELLYRCPFTVTGTLGWRRAEVMRGGVDVRGVDPKSMASKHVAGLFICGEMLDIDGDVGGYNFQFAFASGKAAGAAAAKHALGAPVSKTCT